MPAALLACIDLNAVPVGPKPNPFSLPPGVTMRVHDHLGAPLPALQIKPWPGGQGADCGFRLEIRLRRPATAICLGVMHFARAPKVEAFSPAGTLVGSVTVGSAQRVVHHVVLTSRAIARVVITAPSDEALLTDLCMG